MGRLRRRPRAALPSVYRGLTTGERLALLDGLKVIGDEGFRSSEEYEAAWWRYRDSLIFARGPFLRPEAFWWIEVGQAPPDCSAGGYESERAALIRLGLLSSEEMAILAGNSADALAGAGLSQIVHVDKIRAVELEPPNG